MVAFKLLYESSSEAASTYALIPFVVSLSECSRCSATECDALLPPPRLRQGGWLGSRCVVASADVAWSESPSIADVLRLMVDALTRRRAFLRHLRKAGCREVAVQASLASMRR